MSALYLAGFNPKAQEALGQYFLSRANRPPGWQLTGDLAAATVILVNAANRDIVDECTRLAAPWQELALVGDTDFGSGWLLIPRPVTPSAILAGINQVMAMKAQMGDAGNEEGEAGSGLTSSMPLTRPTRHAPLVPAAPVDAAFTQELQAAVKRPISPGKPSQH
jgi:hypothetical protein